MKELPALLTGMAILIVVLGLCLGFALQDWRMPSALLGTGVAVGMIGIALRRERPA